MSDKLTLRQQSVLAAIQLTPGATLDEIGRTLGVSRERVRQVAVVLEARGLIRPRIELRAEAIRQERARLSAMMEKYRKLRRHLKRARTRRRHRMRAGLPDTGVRTNYLMPGAEAVCSYAGCWRPVRCRGYCAMHYSQLRSTGVLWVRHFKTARCQDCGRAVYARGYCATHYNYHREHGHFQNLQPPKNPAAVRAPQYPRIERDGKYWVLKARESDGTISERKFVEKRFADSALARLMRRP